MGLTTGGAIGAETAKTLDDCVPLIQAMHDAAKEVNPEVIVLCHGGPIAEPDDAAYVLAQHRGHRRLLRSLVDGAAADRDRDDREHAPLQGDSDGRERMTPFRRAAASPDRSTTGASSPQVSGPRDGLAGIVAIEATFLPGKAHPFHFHPGQEEVIYVIEGTIEQWVRPSRRR